MLPAELSPLTRFLDRALQREHGGVVQDVPPTAWFLAYVVAAFACFHWHNRQPLRHLKLMGWGMCLGAVLTLPQLFSAWLGYKQLVFYAEKIMPAQDPADFYERTPRDAGLRLEILCSYLLCVAYVMFALGLWRFAKEAMIRAAHPPADRT